MDEGNGGVTVAEQAEVKESYAEQAVADIEAAKARVRTAIEHYEMQRREAEEHHTLRLAEIDGAITSLRAALEVNGHVAPAPETQTCATPGCTETFVPSRPGVGRPKMYHSPECRLAARRR